MDYWTKPTSRKDLRRFSKYIRKLFDVPEVGPFPVLEVLDQLPDKFPRCNYVVVKDQELPQKTMALCISNNLGGYTITIKETVYEGARKDQIGAFRGFICHEICHLFLLTIGFTPVMARSFETEKIPRYCSMEWQAKALCGEVMIPFEESRGMSQKEIVKKYMVSKAFADFRRKQERR